MTTRLRPYPRKPLPLLDRKTFRLAEESYLDRFLSGVRSLSAIHHPGEGQVYDASARNCRLKHLDEGTLQIKELIRKTTRQDLQALYEQMPKNRAILAEISHREFLRSSRTRVVAAAAAVSPAKELIQEGASRTPGTPADVEFFRRHLIRRNNVFHFIGIFCASGWNPACHSLLSGPNFLIALTDRTMDAWRTFFPPDKRWGPVAELLDPATPQDKREAIRTLVSHCTAELLMDELTEDFILEKLGYARSLVRESFVSIAAQDPFLRYDSTGTPHRLIRIYG